MEYLDANNNPIHSGYYLETFLKGKDEFRNRIVYIGQRDSRSDRRFSIINRANLAPLNPMYSRWLRPFCEELEALDRQSLDQFVHPQTRSDGIPIIHHPIINLNLPK